MTETETYIVAVHRWWASGNYTTSAQKHVGPFTEAEARAYAESLQHPLIGYPQRLTSPVEAGVQTLIERGHVEAIEADGETRYRLTEAGIAAKAEYEVRDA